MFKTISDGIFAQLDDAVKAIKAVVDAQPDHILWTGNPDKDSTEYFDKMYAIVFSACSGEAYEDEILALRVEDGILKLYTAEWGDDYAHGDVSCLDTLYCYRLDKAEDINYAATVISILESLDEYTE